MPYKSFIFISILLPLVFFLTDDVLPRHSSQKVCYALCSFILQFASKKSHKLQESKISNTTAFHTVQQ